MKMRTLRNVRISLAVALACTLAATLLAGRHYLLVRYAPRPNEAYPAVSIAYTGPPPWTGPEHLFVALAALSGALFLIELALFGRARGLDWSRSLLPVAAVLLPTAAFLTVNRGYELYTNTFAYGGSGGQARLGVPPVWRIIGDVLLFMSVAVYMLLLRMAATATHARADRNSSPADRTYPNRAYRNALVLTGVIALLAFAAALFLYHRYIVQLVNISMGLAPGHGAAMSVFPFFPHQTPLHLLLLVRTLIIVSGVSFVSFWLLCARVVGQAEWAAAWLLTACMFIPAVCSLYLMRRTQFLFGSWYERHRTEYWVDPARTHLLWGWITTTAIMAILMLLLTLAVRQTAIRQSRDGCAIPNMR